MPVAHVGLSRGPRPFPNGFRTGRTDTTPTPPVTPPVWLHRTDHIADNRTIADVDARSSTVVSNVRDYEVDNRTTLVAQA